MSLPSPISAASTSAGPSPLLVASGLGFSYGQSPVLADVSLIVQPGELLAILGPNGSGKSTLIRLLLGHLRGHGNITWLGKPLRQWSRRHLARHVAYLPQSPQAEPGQTVGQVLSMGRTPYLHLFGIESANDRRIIQQTAEQLDLIDLLDRPLSSLSGGQQQRVFVGRCLAQEPRVLMLDEPNTFMDLQHQVELCQRLRTLAHQQNLAIVMALHDLNLAAAYADQVLILKSGRVAATGHPQQVLQEPLLRDVFGLPLRRLDLPEIAHPVILPISCDPVKRDPSPNLP